MAEYSRIATGSVVSNGGATNVILPFTPNYIRMWNPTEAAAATGEVSSAEWTIDMGQGAAQYVITSMGPADGSNSTTTGGFSTIQAGLSLQYGPVYQHTGSTDFAIAKAATPTVTCSTAHGLVTGNVIVFQNLYQTSTTGMPQICGIPFMITKTGTDTFTIPWDCSGSNYTAFNTATSAGNIGSWKQVLYPSLYAPGEAVISAVSLGSTTVVTTTAPHNFVVGQEVAFRIPSVWGPSQLNSLPDLIIPGSPIYGYVTVVNSSTQVTVNINSTGYTAYTANQSVASVKGLTFPQIVAVGDNNSGSNQFGYNSPTVYNGTGATAVSTINGPAIAGAYINATYQGFIIGSTISGTSSDVLYYMAVLSDINL